MTNRQRVRQTWRRLENCINTGKKKRKTMKQSKKETEELQSEPFRGGKLNEHK